MNRAVRPIVIGLVLVAALVGGIAVARPVAQDVLLPGGPAGGNTLYRDFGTYQTQVVSLAPYDTVSGAPYWLDVAHYEIHYGGMFHAEFTNSSVANNGTVNVLMSTGDTGGHAIFEVAVGGQSSVQFWEAPTAATGSTVVPAFNMNRWLTRTAESLIYAAPTITATGELTLVNRIIPAGATVQTRVGGQSSKGVEWVLAPNTDYLLRVTNTSGGAVPVSVMLEWYEAQ